MEWLVDNWMLIVLLISSVAACVVAIRKFAGLPTEDQVKSIKEWLLWAVIEAEKELGSGTGKLKLRQVYDMFVIRFPWAAKAVTFEMFAIWVDEALVEMKRLLHSNDNVKSYVDGEC